MYIRVSMMRTLVFQLASSESQLYCHLFCAIYLLIATLILVSFICSSIVHCAIANQRSTVVVAALVSDNSTPAPTAELYSRFVTFNYLFCF